MNILNLLEEISVQPKRTAATYGGEYHSSCPACGGKDRFCIWPNSSENGRYWCRRCLRSGDTIQFCKDFLGLTYTAACEKVGVKPRPSTKSFQITTVSHFIPRVVFGPTEAWCQRAKDFIQRCHIFLCSNLHLLNIDKDRGLTERTIMNFKLGWNASEKFEPKASWGLQPVDEIGGKSMCFPEGVVIPLLRMEQPFLIKIRRNNWSPDSDYPKYHIVAGSKTCPAIYGDITKPIVIVEAELDAMLVQQLAGDLCCCVSLGGVGNRSDSVLHDILLYVPRVLYALDFDDAGKKAYLFWRSIYPNIVPWPVPVGKSPGDAYGLGVDIRGWIASGLQSKIH